jgi:hypothetical protein
MQDGVMLGAAGAFQGWKLGFSKLPVTVTFKAFVI